MKLQVPENKPVSFSEEKEGWVFSIPALLSLIRATLERGAVFRFKATGFSMSPFVKDGDVITLSPLFDIPPYFGDIVAFVRPKTGKLVIHRITGKYAGYYNIKGDNTWQVDSPIAEKNILGRLVKVERDGRHIRFGRGLERFLIAFLSRRNLLPLLFRGWRVVPFFVRRFLLWTIRL